MYKDLDDVKWEMLAEWDPNARLNTPPGCTTKSSRRWTEPAGSMQKTYTYRVAYRQSTEQRDGTVTPPGRHHWRRADWPTQALDGLPGVPSIVLDDNNTVSIGSRAVLCQAPAEIWNRLGWARGFCRAWHQWKVGKVFSRRLAYQFDLLPEAQHKMPAMINLQQYYLEEKLGSRSVPAGGPALEAQAAEPEQNDATRR